MLTELKVELIIETAQRLSERIGERFPDSGLERVSRQLIAEAQEAKATAPTLAQPQWWLRASLVMFIVLAATVTIAGMFNMHLEEDITDFAFFIQILEPALNVIVFAAAALIFFVTIESRLNRRRVLPALHQLRSLAHIIDMHQLTKDPERLQRPILTPASPKMEMGAFELNRYLNYCSEMQSLTGKIAAVYAQHFSDAVVLSAVNEIESLTTGLSRKIWQKIIVLDSMLDESAKKPRNPIRIEGG